jgi:hypothetical protein
VDLMAVLRGSTDWAALAGFLLRRRPQAHPGFDLQAATIQVTQVYSASAEVCQGFRG